MQRRILFVSNLFPPMAIGGAEIVAFRHAVALAARGHALAVFAGRFQDAEYLSGSISLEEGNGFPIYRLAMRSLSPDENFYWPEAGDFLRSVIAVHRPEIVHFHNLPGLGANLIPVAKAAGTRTIVTLHDHWGFCYKNTLLRTKDAVCSNFEECTACLSHIRISDEVQVPIRLRRDYILWCLSNADLLLSPSASLASAYLRALPEGRPMFKLSYGVDLAAVPAVERTIDGCVEFACFSYLGEHKGILTLLSAVEQLARHDDLRGKWRLTIAGDGHLAEDLVQDIAANRFRGGVNYAGRLPNPAALELLARSHVVILASIWPENEPVTLLEAIASGAAQLATRVGGNVELVEHGRSGLLVSPGNVDELTDAMKLYILQPERISEYGNFNIQRRSRFDQALVIDRLESTYATIRAATPGGDLVVICAGGSPSLEARLMIDHFHVLEHEPVRGRFIWHEWADEMLWRSAGILWFWRDPGKEDVPLILRAHRHGIPILLPRGARVLPLVGQLGNSFSYANFLDAMGMIAALIDAPELSSEFGLRGKSVARLIGTIAPRWAFSLALQ
jgi:glycosyltransferase involved in cell wall biosynthesis